MNLLVEPRVASRPAGDTNEMLAARRRFLQRGHYRRLSDAVNELVEEHFGGDAAGADGSAAACVLDAGCGEGYYLGRLKQHLDTRSGGSRLSYVGADVSRDAARLAARKYRDILFVVANTWRRLPLGPGSVRILLNIFAPRNASEFARLLVRHGPAIVVIPGPKHLVQLRMVAPLLDVQEDKERQVVQQFAPWFDLSETERLDYEIDLDQDGLSNLLAMTPNAWHLSEHDWQTVRAIEQIRITASLRLLVFRRS